jgi:hypothetical protein
VSHCPLLHDNSRYLKRFLPSFLFRRPDAGIDRRSCGASIGAKKVAGRMYPFGPEGPGAAVPGPLPFCRNASHPVEPSLIPIEGPRCRRCQARMTLARVEPGPAGSVLRTFGCPKCERVQKVLAEEPIKSHMANWLNSGLRPPE